MSAKLNVGGATTERKILLHCRPKEKVDSGLPPKQGSTEQIGGMMQVQQSLKDPDHAVRQESLDLVWKKRWVSTPASLCRTRAAESGMGGGVVAG